MKPWHLEGHASVTILLWDVPVDIGPIEWGEHDESIAPPVSPANLPPKRSPFPPPGRRNSPPAPMPSRALPKTTPPRCSSIPSAHWK